MCVHRTPGSNPLLLQTNSRGLLGAAATDRAVLCEQHSIIHCSVNSKQERRLDGTIADTLIFYKSSSLGDRKHRVINRKTLQIHWTPDEAQPDDTDRSDADASLFVTIPSRAVTKESFFCFVLFTNARKNKYTYINTYSICNYVF